ncbi:P-loop containing nucleoside triphosphate hydrolase protein [Martensiomyces pterosporus]|nr:P-loop containing nucleoside triphosphate hydrolase protein [Martensiomyces pterosporus]
MFTAIQPAQYKHIAQPEITFAGRSNVGKSSLINAVLNSQRLVKTSKKPGHTSALNFFSLTSKASPNKITLVDMPGYGFRSRDEWGKFIMSYLSTRQVLRRVFLLVEAKVGQLKDTDRSFLELVEEYNVPTQVVLTKTDKLRAADLDRISADVVRSAIDIAPSVVQPRVIHCSSRTKAGIRSLQQEILQACGAMDTSKTDS